ncbi:MAG: Fic family protein [Halobacteriovoraceae bacterium]|nr:Fic family protein [Halobacteriovoraceae bacterium]
MNSYKFLVFVSIFLLTTCSSVVESPYSLRGPSSLDSSCRDLINEVIQKKFITTRKKFGTVLRKEFSATEAKNVEKNLDALLFVDYVHTYPTLKEILDGEETFFTASISDIYRDSGSRVFKNYLEASKYLFERKPKFSIETLQQVHKKMMAGGIDGIPTAKIGKFRTEDIIGNVPRGYEIDQKQFEALVENPYINTSRLNGSAQNGYTGYIGYPNASYNTPEILKMIKKSNKGLHDEIIEFQKNGVGDFEELTGRLINQLTEDLLDWFVKQKNQIGSINSVAKFKRYAKLSAEFQRNLISIHPFYDGNGRSIRQFALYYPFWLQGLPPPRMADVNSDIYNPLDEWTEQIIEGVYGSHALYTSLTERISKGLRIGGTPELTFPKIPKKYGLTYRSQKPRKTIKNWKQTDVDPAQFQEFADVRLETDTELRALFDEKPNEALDQLIDEYMKFAAKSNMVYKHAKFGEERIGLSLVDVDFWETFANQSYVDPKAWKAKIDRYYKDQTVWRGLSRGEEIEEDEIVGMFQELHHQFVSNRLMGFTNNPEILEEELAKDFGQYNNDVVNEGLVRMAKDHSESGPLYGESYGYSTSKKWEVGRAFAMGAMVVAEYGQHWDHQHLLKSRVLVGMKQANKDVELPRLKQLRPEFSYKYPRQVEVMGVGAADPDSVMYVQLIDDQGDAFLTYVRNPKKPSEILVYEGDVRDASKLPRKKPLRKINLQ